MEREEPLMGAPNPDAGAPSAADDSIIALFSRVIDDGERFVLAEIRLYRARLLNRLSTARWAIVIALGALFLAQSTVVALLVGLILALQHPLGIMGATIAVTGGALVIAGTLLLIAIVQFRRATAVDPERPAR
ncbi:MAG: phage holin family protein [Sphingomonas sp.]